MYIVHMVVWVLLVVMNITVTIPVHSWLHCFIVQKTVRRMYKQCNFDVLSFWIVQIITSLSLHKVYS